MKKIITLNRNEIDIVNGGANAFFLGNTPDVNTNHPDHKGFVVKVAAVTLVVAAAIGIIVEIGSCINYCTKDQLRDIEPYLSTKNFELMMYYKANNLIA